MHLEGHFCLRERLAISFFLKKDLQINNIRIDSFKPGIRKFEIHLFSLIDKLIPGSSFEINENGTKMKFHPGGGLQTKVFHYVGKYRSLGYYLEFILYLSSIKSNAMEIKLSGLRSTPLDVSLEAILYVTIPLHRKWAGRDTRVKIFSNSFSLVKNTDLVLISPNLNFGGNIRIIQPGVLKKLRLILSHSSGSISVRELIKGFLQKKQLSQEVDFSFFRFKIPNKSLNFTSLTLVGQTSKGCIFGNDFSTSKKNLNSVLWKNILDQTFLSFFEDVKTGSCIDNRNQIFLMLKVLWKKKKEPSVIRIGKLTLSSIFFFRDVKRFVGSGN
jgi:hypothetical protein